MASNSGARSKKTLRAIIGWTVTLAVVWAISFVTVSVATEVLQKDFRTADVLREGWGVDVSEPLSITLGSVAEGGQGEFTLRTRLLSATATASIQPGSAVRIGLDSTDAGFILEVPYRKMQFHKTAPSPADTTVLFVVDEAVHGSAHQEARGHEWRGLWRVGVNHTDPPIQEMVEWEALREAGPAGFMLDHLVAVHLVLTPDQHDRYLGAEFPGADS